MIVIEIIDSYTNIFAHLTFILLSRFYIKQLFNFVLFIFIRNFIRNEKFENINDL